MPIQPRSHTVFMVNGQRGAKKVRPRKMGLKNSGEIVWLAGRDSNPDNLVQSRAPLYSPPDPLN
jgi:hypothetical protein